MMGEDDTDHQTVFADYIKDVLADEDSRRATLESRGASVITASGALVTLLFALAALVTKQQNFTLGGWPRGLLSAGTVALVAAAILAIGTYAPRSTRLTDPIAFARQLPKLWEHDNDFARKKTTITRLVELANNQRVNDIKARLLLAAVAFEVLGVLFVASTVLMVLL